VISNPDRWNNNFAKKMMDMQLHFSCGPLRVAKACPEHWERLHASHKTVIPLPGGKLELMEARIPHTSDAELQKLVDASGMGKSRSEIKPDGKASLSVIPKREVTTPLLRSMLMSTYVAPLPRKVEPNDPSVALQRRRAQLEGTLVAAKAADIASDSNDSVFSKTTVGPQTTISTVSKAQKFPPSDLQRKPVVLSATGSAVSKTPSSLASRVSKLREEISKERSVTAVAMEHIRAASRQLDDVERLLASR
jgi:hypothetical protein